MKNSAAYKWVAIVAITAVFAAYTEDLIEYVEKGGHGEEGHLDSHGDLHGFKDVSKIKSSTIKALKRKCGISLIDS